MRSNLDKRFLYSNGTLKNKLNIHSEDKLEKLTHQISAAKSKEFLKHSYKVRDVNDLIKVSIP